MAIKKISSNVDFISLEHEVLKFWENKNIFNKRRNLNKGNEKWSFIDGPITANNPMGVHHAWGRTLKDIYNRYKSMCGFELRYQNGFDCQGLWVEIEVEKELGFESKRDVEEFGIEKFVTLCKERVDKYSKIQTEQSKRLGYWMDWDNSYYTMSDENNYTIWSFLKKLWTEGKVYRGTDVVPWSGRSGTSYSQMEIIEGRKLVAHKSVFVRFPIKNRANEFLLIWTTTPWTLSSNVVVGINKDLDYMKLKTKDGSIYYFAKDNLEFQRLEKQFNEKKQWVDGVSKLKTLSQIFKERGGYEELGSIKGSEMIGWKYEGPYDNFEAQKEFGGYPHVNDDLKEKRINSAENHKVIDPGKDAIGNDIVVAGEKKGRIKSLIDSSGNQVKEAGPSTPIEVLGLEECVAAGEVFNVMKNEKDARAIIDSRLFFHKEKNDKNVITSKSAFDLLDQEKINKLRVIIKSDVAGTSEAINNSLKNSSAKENSITKGKIISIENEVVTIDVGTFYYNVGSIFFYLPGAP